MSSRFVLVGLDGMNLLLARHFAAEGHLPTYARLLQTGTSNRLLPTIPAWTPTNWASIVTGAPSGSHSLPGWSVRLKSDPIDAPSLACHDSRSMGAETIWEVGDQAGRRVLVQYYPASWPSRVPGGYVLTPAFRDTPFPIANARVYDCRVTDTPGPQAPELPGGRRTVDVVEEGPAASSAALALRPASDWRNVPGGSLATELPVAYTQRRGQTRLYLLAVPSDTGFVRLAICAEPDGATALVELEAGRWSPFVRRSWGDLGEGTVRFRLLEADRAAGRVRLVRSMVYPVRGWSDPAGLEEELLEQVGPFFEGYSTTPGNGQAELDAFLDEMLDQGMWQVRAARYVAETRGWDWHFSHWHIFDNINHSTINQCDPLGPYDAATRAWHITAQRRAYQVADQVLAAWLELVGADDYFLALSDHGMYPCHRWCNVNGLLVQHGLMALREDGVSIDWARSQVYTSADRGAEVFINLRGREPSGIVAPDDFERLQEQVIDLLHGWRDPLDDRRVVAFALKLEDCQPLGLWDPERTGDVVFTYQRGYGWGPPTDGALIGPGRGGLHGSQVPNAERGLMTNMGGMIMTGPGVRAGYERNWQRYGLMRQLDIAPTIAHLSGLRPPAQSMGAVLHDLFER
jgi:predicted AlkP superfamily phosphohydrolase/phosphomutase